YLTPSRRVTRGSDRNLVRLGAAWRADGIRQIAGRQPRQKPGKLATGFRAKMTIAHIERLERVTERGDHLRMAVAEIVGPAIEMKILKLTPVHIPDAIALPPSDRQRHARAEPRLHPHGHEIGVVEFEYPALARRHLHPVEHFLQRHRLSSRIRCTCPVHWPAARTVSIC